MLTTDGVQVKGKYYGDKSVFYKNDKNAKAVFLAAAMDMLGEKIFEMLGRDALIRLQNATLLRLSEKARAGVSAHEKNV